MSRPASVERGHQRRQQITAACSSSALVNRPCKDVSGNIDPAVEQLLLAASQQRVHPLSLVSHRHLHTPLGTNPMPCHRLLRTSSRVPAPRRRGLPRRPPDARLVACPHPYRISGAAFRRTGGASRWSPARIAASAARCAANSRARSRVVRGARSAADGAAAAREIGAAVTPCRLDVTDPETVAAAVECVERPRPRRRPGQQRRDRLRHRPARRLGRPRPGRERAGDEPARRLASDPGVPAAAASRPPGAHRQRQQRGGRDQRDERRHPGVRGVEGGAQRVDPAAGRGAAPRRSARQRGLPGLDRHRHGPRRPPGGRRGRERRLGGLAGDDGPTGGFFRDGRPLPW